MIGAVGEILGAVGVIATLGYLASQIKHSRVESQQRAVGELLNQAQLVLGQISGSVEVANLWRRGMAADPDLTVDEVIQFRVLLTELIYVWERLFYLDQAGHAEPWVVHNNRASRRDVLGGAGFRLWFDVRKHHLSPDFRLVLERELAEAGDYQPMGVGTNQSLGHGVEPSVPRARGTT